MILKIYKNKNTFKSNNDNYYFLKNTDNDKNGIFGTSLKRVISRYKEHKNYMISENTVEIYLELINCKEYNTLDELEFDYLEELIWF